ncbi:hypothetical protein BSL78_26097 [Apostichopus japonicus]|uniref:Reverse transcriptase domain-containing protein n=1 Tax=Stichopus japonicus TaxID=307972 RepID=A0A2G8JMY1_STIJA|nr:hypothetical protein BSL78_26097 [Apostichopus japonicus]
MGFQNLVDFATFPRSGSILDAVYVNNHYYRATRRHPIGSSDHYSICIMPKYTEKHRETKQRPRRRERDIRDNNLCILRETIASTDWNIFTETCPTLNELTEVVSCYIQFVSDICVPTRTVPTAEMMKRLPADDNIRRMEERKKKAIEVGNNAERNRLQRTINRYIYRKRSEHFERIATDSTSLWNFLKSVRNPHKNDNKVTISRELGSKLDTHFGRFNSAVIKDITLNLPHRSVNDTPGIERDQVKRQFGLVKRGVASGIDNIPWWVFKYCSNEIADIFTVIFNESIKQSIIPSDWKHAKTTPVPKICSPASVNDYRPIDISSIGFNCLQKLLLSYVTQSIDEHGDPNQFAYRKGISCTDAILTLSMA